ncbi:MAG: DUF547 domain-containing protein [Planctomycetota bacterium]|jgi:hypothetical protein
MHAAPIRRVIVPAAALVLVASCGREPAPGPTASAPPSAEPPDTPPSELITPPAAASDVPRIGDDDEAAPDEVLATDAALEELGDAVAAAEDALSGAEIIARADSIYSNVLAHVVTPAGLVHYELLADPRYEGSLNLVVQSYAAAALPEATPARLAFWCNAYNANVLSLALVESRRAGFETVDQVPGFFDERTITVAGETLTLNALESDRIRPLDDARIHAALVCAAMSCPPLRVEPYAADRLDAQFEDQCRRWVNDETKNRVADGALALSRIFEWYGADFETPRFKGIHGFLAAYAWPEGSIGRLLATEPRPLMTWLEYDWSLNQAPGAPEGGK